MAASASATASGGSSNFNTNDDSWSVLRKSKAAALAARFNYSWAMTADAKTCNSPIPPGPSQSGPKFNSPPTTGYTWPTMAKSCTGSAGSRAWATESGYSVRNAASHWSRYKVFMTATANTAIATAGKASSTSTVNDPWHVDYPATGSRKIHNLLMLQTSLAGSLTDLGRGGSPVRSAGLGMNGSMGKLSVGLDFTTGKLSVGVRLAPGWIPYVGIRFPKSRRMAAPAPSTAKEIRALLMSLFNARQVAWKTKAPIELTFVKDVGSAAGSADLTLDVFASQDAAGE